MIIVVLSHPKRFDGEAKIICDLFENGLQAFHLRKKAFSFDEMEQFIKDIPRKYHPRIVIHSHYSLALKYDLMGLHLSGRRRKNKLRYWLRLWYYRIKKPTLQISSSFNYLASLLNDKGDYHYVFLSPIFDTISKSGFNAAFNFNTLKTTIMNSRHKIVALGGVNYDRIDQVKEMGFYGVVLSGAIWDVENKVEAFKLIRKKLLEV
jgi:thiamine-phosphate pyrophosphorylase